MGGLREGLGQGMLLLLILLQTWSKYLHAPDYSSVEGAVPKGWLEHCLLNLRQVMCCCE